MTATLEVRKSGVWEPVGGAAPAADWVRPADWLALPTLNVGEQKFVGLYAVYPGDSNQVALRCAGAYTVDWGDGSAPENVATNTTVNHNTAFASVSSGTLTSDGYRQTVVTITPQAGQTLTSVDLHYQPTGVTSGYSSLWLDIAVVGASISTLKISGTTVRAGLLQRFTYVGPSAVTTQSAMFQNARALRSIVGTAWTSGITSFSIMFSGCSSLRSLPLLTTSAGTNFSFMFQDCKSLITVPAFNTAAGTNFSSMFNGCASLSTVPLFTTSAGTNFGTMFSGCSSLTMVPLINTGSGTIFSSMFASCVSLQSVPLINTASGTVFDRMFDTCVSLQSVPLINTAAGIDFSFMFAGCVSLRTVPLFSTAAGTAFNSMFTGCTSLQSVPLFNTAAGASFGLMFQNCFALQSVPMFNTAASTYMVGMFASCSSLQIGALSGTKLTISYASCKLSGPQLDAIYTGLASGVTGQTVTVTGNWGVATDTPSLATAKGWTVSG